MQSTSTNRGGDPVLSPIAETKQRHHPGYQFITRQSWWCDQCLQDCSTLQEQEAAADERWYDFFIWLSDLLIKGAALSLSAIFCIIAYSLGAFDVSSASAAQGQRDLDTLKRQREDILDEIDRLKTARGKAHFDSGNPSPEEIENAMYKCETLLRLTGKEIQELERELGVLRADNQLECLIAAQHNMDGDNSRHRRND
jgi:hypothetical protein